MGSNLPIRIDKVLIRQARISGRFHHRSISEQIEHWALLGHMMERALNPESICRVGAFSRPIKLEEAIAGARSPAGKKKGPLTGSKTKILEKLERRKAKR